MLVNGRLGRGSVEGDTTKRFREVAKFVERRTNGRQGEMVSTRAGLRRGILLGLRESAKSIASEPELACGSNS